MKCDKCNKEVPPENDATYLYSIIYNEPIALLIFGARHLFPTDDCEGSPSRAQYLGGPPDTRGYELDESLIPRYEEAYRKMVETCLTRSNPYAPTPD